MGAKKRCATDCWRQAVAKLLSERTKAFVHTISMRKKSGTIVALPSPAVLQPLAAVPCFNDDVDMIAGDCPVSCAWQTLWSLLHRCQQLALLLLSPLKRHALPRSARPRRAPTWLIVLHMLLNI